MSYSVNVYYYLFNYRCATRACKFFPACNLSHAGGNRARGGRDGRCGCGGCGGCDVLGVHDGLDVLDVQDGLDVLDGYGNLDDHNSGDLHGLDKSLQHNY